MQVVLNENGKILFTIKCSQLNKGDYIKHKDSTYMIIAKQFDLDINDVEYIVKSVAAII